MAVKRKNISTTIHKSELRKVGCNRTQLPTPPTIYSTAGGNYIEIFFLCMYKVDMECSECKGDARKGAQSYGTS